MPDPSETLVEILRRRAALQPDDRLYTFLADGESEEVHLTYGELDRRARAIAATLQTVISDQGLVIGEKHRPPITSHRSPRALLLYPPGLDYIAAFFGCLYAGVIAVPVYPPDPSRLEKTLPRFLSIVNDALPSVILTNAEILGLAEGFAQLDPALKRPHWIASQEVSEDMAVGWKEPTLNGESLAFLQYTSGSTAAPRGVRVTHGNILYNEKMIVRGMEMNEKFVCVSWTPFYHDMGLIGHVLNPLYVGFPSVFISPFDFFKHPLCWLKAISRYRATISGAPNFAYDLCVRKISSAERATLDLSSWDVALNGAEPIRHDTLERFADYFAPCGFRREAFYPSYGLAEATLIVSGGQRQEAPIMVTVDHQALQENRIVRIVHHQEKGQRLVGCGRTLLDQKIVIADPDRLSRCPPDQIGEIWVSGPSVAKGYWNRPEETAETFQACLKDTGEGPFLRTGDLGFLDNGELFITGRIKDLIIIRGQNYYPHDIERTVERSHPLLRPGCGAAFSIEVSGEERLVVLQELNRETDLNAEEVLERIREAVSRFHELEVHAVALLKPQSIPKTSSGKIQRHACRERFLRGSLEVLGSRRWDTVPVAPKADTLTREALLAKEPQERQERLESYLLSNLARILARDPSLLNRERHLNALGLDSLKAVEMKTHIENNLGVALKMETFLSEMTIVRLAGQILDAMAVPSHVEPEAMTAVAVRRHPLSANQKALWSLQQLYPRSSGFNVIAAMRIRGDLDLPALRRAWKRLVERHPALRSTFPADQREPFQEAQERAEVCFQEIDASSWTETTLADRLFEEANRPFDLKNDPPLRVHLFARSVQESILLITLHHIVTDLWSNAILLREFGLIYAAEKNGLAIPLKPLEYGYGDYVRHQTEMLAGSEGKRHWEYWRNQLAGDLPMLRVRHSLERPAVRTEEGGSRILKLDAELIGRLKDLAMANETTLFTTLLAAFQWLLHRYSGQEEILVGTPMLARSRPEFSGIVGFFVNPVILRSRLNGSHSFRTFLRQARRTVLDAIEHQDYPFFELVNRLQPTRDLVTRPIFQAFFDFLALPGGQNADVQTFFFGETDRLIEAGGLRLEPVSVKNKRVNYDLTLVLAEVEGGVWVKWFYNTSIFLPTVISRMMNDYEALLKEAVFSQSPPD